MRPSFPALLGSLALALVGGSHAFAAGTVVKSIGSLNRDFSTLQAWATARSGDLVARHVWSVTGGSGRFVDGEIVDGTACSGKYVPEDEARTNGAVMTVDDAAGQCAANAVLVGKTSRATAVFRSVSNASGTVERGEVHNDSVLTSRVVIGGSTVDAGHHFWLTAAAGQAHGGIPGTGARLVVNEAWAPAITINAPYTVIEKLEVVNSATGGNPTGIYNTATTGARYDRLIVHAPGGTAIYFPAATTSNVLVHGSRIGIYASYGSGQSIFNATIVRSAANGIYNQFGVGPKLVNVVAFGSGTADFFSAGGWAAGSQSNAGSGDGPPPGPRSAVISPADFVDYDADDLRPSASSLLKDAGTDLDAVFTTDISGAPRTAPWDIGAYEAPPSQTAGSTSLVVKSIGTNRRDFSTLQAWETARSGNLVTRQVWRVTAGTGRFDNAEIVTGNGCSGVYVPEDEARTNGAAMTLDNVSGRCAANASLVGRTSGARAVFASVTSTGGTVERGEVYNDSPLTERLVIGGSAVDRNHYLWLTAAPGQGHNGTPGSGARVVIEDAWSRAISVGTPYTVIEHLEIVNNGISGTSLFANATLGTRYDRLIVQATHGTAIYYPASVISNTLVHDSQVGVYSSYGDYATVYNTTVVKARDHAFVNAAGTGPRLINVAALGNGAGTFSSGGGWQAGSNTNAGPSDGAPPGRNAVTVAAGDFRDYPGGDFRPAAVSALKNTGTDLSALFTIDLAAVQRGPRWDIGAYETPLGDGISYPVRSEGAPTGLLGAGTTSVTLSITTDRASTCRYGPTAGTSFASLPTLFATTGGTLHTNPITGLRNGSSFTAYIRCLDAKGNANPDDYVVSFRIATVTVDAKQPARSAGAPSGALPSGTRSAMLSLLTSEAATCKYGTQPGTPFASLPNTFGTTGGMAHATTVAQLVDASYTFYVRCSDPAGNTNSDDYLIRFSVGGPPPDIVPPRRTAGAPAGTLAKGTRSATLRLATDEAATCRYGPTPGVDFAALALTLGTTDGRTHSTPLSGLTDSTRYAAYVRCKDSDGNVNADDYLITFEVGPSVFDTLPDNAWMKLDTVPTERYICVQFTDCTGKAVLTNPVARYWSGMAHGDGMLFYFGGGHQGHQGNDVEIFDIASNAWIQQYQPEGLPAICLVDPSADPACVVPKGGYGSPVPTPLGRPSVQHAFQKIAYDPVRKHFIAGLQSGTWAYDVATRTWTRLTPNLPPSPGAPQMLMIYDPGLQTVLWFPITATDGDFVYRFNYATNSWVIHDAYPFELRFSYVYSAYDPNRGRHLIVQLGQTGGRTMWLYDAVHKQWTEITNIPSQLTTMQSVDFDTANRVFVLIQPHDNGYLELWAYDALGQWSVLQPAGARPIGTPGVSSLWNVLKYDPVAKVFFFLDVKIGQSSGTDRAEEGAVETWVYRYRK